MMEVTMPVHKVITGIKGILVPGEGWIYCNSDDHIYGILDNYKACITQYIVNKDSNVRWVASHVIAFKY